MDLWWLRFNFLFRLGVMGKLCINGTARHCFFLIAAANGLFIKYQYTIVAIFKLIFCDNIM